MSRRAWRVTALICVAGMLAGLVLHIYWLEAWGRSAYDIRTRLRIGQLAALYSALLDYRQETGHWPVDVHDVEGRYEELMGEGAAVAPSDSRLRPYYGFPPTTGSERVEYCHPRRDQGILLRSFGQYEAQPGWNLKRDPIVLSVTVTGSVVGDGQNFGSVRGKGNVHGVDGAEAAGP